MPEHGHLARKLRTLREDRGLSLYRAAEGMPGLWRRTLQRLEDGDAVPQRTPIATVLTLVVFYWPKLSIDDFLDNPELRIFRLLKRKARR